MLTSRPLFDSDLFKVNDRKRSGPRGDWGAESGAMAPCVIFIRNGAFACRATARDLVVSEPLNVKVYDGAHSFQYRQLVDEDVNSTLVEPGEALFDEAFRGLGYQIAVPNSLHLKHVNLHRRLSDRTLTGLAAEEAILELLDEVSRIGGWNQMSNGLSARFGRRIDDVRALIAAEPDADHRLSDLARIAGCSAFHFARMFRAQTGHSLRAYRLRLRTAMAVARISQGETDLATVAMDTGFSHHSHMTAAFRTILSSAPSAVRQALFRPTAH